METIEKLSREKLPKITVLAGEDLGQYSQAKEKFLKQIAFYHFKYFWRKSISPKL